MDKGKDLTLADLWPRLTPRQVRGRLRAQKRRQAAVRASLRLPNGQVVSGLASRLHLWGSLLHITGKLLQLAIDRVKEAVAKQQGARMDGDGGGGGDPGQTPRPTPQGRGRPRLPVVPGQLPRGAGPVHRREQGERDPRGRRAMSTGALKAAWLAKMPPGTDEVAYVRRKMQAREQAALRRSAPPGMPRRGRGRPRKDVAAPVEANGMPTRRRGRPRKDATPGAGGAAAGGTELGPRKERASATPTVGDRGRIPGARGRLPTEHSVPGRGASSDGRPTLAPPLGRSGGGASVRVLRRGGVEDPGPQYGACSPGCEGDRGDVQAGGSGTPRESSRARSPRQACGHAEAAQPVVAPLSGPAPPLPPPRAPRAVCPRTGVGSAGVSPPAPPLPPVRMSSRVGGKGTGAGAGADPRPSVGGEGAGDGVGEDDGGHGGPPMPPPRTTAARIRQCRGDGRASPLLPPPPVPGAHRDDARVGGGEGPAPVPPLRMTRARARARAVDVGGVEREAEGEEPPAPPQPPAPPHRDHGRW